MASDGAEGDFFGQRVAISSDTVVIGAAGDDDLGFQSGSAYVFERDHGGTENWGQVTKLLASDGEEGDFFGSVAISGNTMVVGANLDNDNGFDSGSAYIFDRDQEGINNWGQVTKLLASDGAVEDFFGFEVAISGDTVIIGAQNDDDNASIQAHPIYLVLLPILLTKKVPVPPRSRPNREPGSRIRHPGKLVRRCQWR